MPCKTSPRPRIVPIGWCAACWIRSRAGSRSVSAATRPHEAGPGGIGMPELRTRDNLATGEFAEIEERLERFDAAWRTGIVPGIGAFLPPPDNPSRREVLEELIKIDLEY